MRVWPLMMAEAPFNRSCKASLSGSPTWSSMPGTRSISACFWMMSKPYSVQSMYAVFMGVSDGLHGWIDVFLVGFLFQPQMKPDDALQVIAHLGIGDSDVARSEEHTSELQSLMRISYAVFCLKKKKYQSTTI